MQDFAEALPPLLKSPRVPDGDCGPPAPLPIPVPSLSPASRGAESTLRFHVHSYAEDELEVTPNETSPFGVPGMIQQGQEDDSRYRELSALQDSFSELMDGEQPDDNSFAEITQSILDDLLDDNGDDDDQGALQSSTTKLDRAKFQALEEKSPRQAVKSNPKMNGGRTGSDYGPEIFRESDESSPGAYLVQDGSVARAPPVIKSSFDTTGGGHHERRDSDLKASRDSEPRKSKEDATMVLRHAPGYNPPSPERGYRSPTRHMNNNNVGPSPESDFGSDQRSRLFVASSFESDRPVVVAAEVVSEDLSLDAERRIEEQVQRRMRVERQQFIQQAPRADVVSIEHSNTRSENQDNDEEARRIAAFKERHKPKGLREKLFGDSRVAGDVDISATPECIRKREYLRWSVKKNRMTNMWVASIQTKEKGTGSCDTAEMKRDTRSYAATSQAEAYETGLALATPKMLPFDQYPICHVCNAKFAVFRRPRHCRNCGVCICSNCSVSWPSKMIPDTYNTGLGSQVNVCLGCDWLSSAFREALVEGRLYVARDLYDTGNVNLRSPYCNVKKDEIL
jgi:hypothetical protein